MAPFLIGMLVILRKSIDVYLFMLQMTIPTVLPLFLNMNQSHEMWNIWKYYSNRITKAG